MTKEDYLQKLSREQLTDEQIVDGFERFYSVKGFEEARRDLLFRTTCCMTTALLAVERLKKLIIRKVPTPASN